ncbi:MAG: DUF2797 domain-containing protein [Bacteroidia bacterium]|nr:MAG: DUF2797 domain-containing protein [Bacteroidia bacterium]
MEIIGNISKMESSSREVVQYLLPLGNRKIIMNELIGQAVQLDFKGKIHCIKCGRETRKSFAQGYCYPCFTTAPETEECVLRPELCRAHEGVARDMEYAEKHCLSDQVVYLSITSGLKVGVTRSSQVPARWIDQGALKAIEFARTPNRYTAGLMEVALKNHIADKTNWRKMLLGSDPGHMDLVSEKARLKAMVPEELRSYLTENESVIELTYPVERYPEKIRSLDFDKDPMVSGVLTGIKGQYLMFDQDRVINVRKFGGYLVQLTTSV